MDNLATNVKWNINVFVEDGPTLSSSGQLNSGGSDPIHSVTTINATIPKDGTEKPISVQSGSLEDFEFIFMKSDKYVGTDKTKNLSYKFTDSTGDSDSVIFKKDHILTSSDVIGLFGKAPNSIKFTNDIGDDVNINIVVAKKAVT